MSHQQDCDVLIIGSGAAGLSLALHLADRFSVYVLAKRAITEGATYYAQGGVSAVIDQNDSIESHVEDTLRAGAGLCHREVVEAIVKEGRARIDWLLAQGVPFTTTDTADGGHTMHLTQEGGHSKRRVVHAADATGRAIETTLLERARAHSNITLWAEHIAIDLISTGKLGGTPDRCIGAYVLDKEGNKVKTLRARWSVLSTRGLPAGARTAPAPAPPEGDAAATGRAPWTTVTLPPSMILQPRLWASAALLVYSLPQRQTFSCACACTATTDSRLAHIGRFQLVQLQIGVAQHAEE